LQKTIRTELPAVAMQRIFVVGKRKPQRTKQCGRTNY